MDVIYRRGQATAAEVLAELPDPPSYSAVRAMLRVLEEKGHLRHEQQGPQVRVPADGSPREGAAIGAEATGADVLRRLDRADRGRAARPVGEQPVGRGARPALPAHQPGPEGGSLTMNSIFDLVLRSFATIAVDAAGKSALVLAAAGAPALVLHRASAAARHLAWCLGLAGSLVLPALALVVPVWVWPILPVRERPEPTGALAQPSLLTAASVGSAPLLPAGVAALNSNQSSPDAANLDAPSAGLSVAGSRVIPPAPRDSVRIRLPSLSLWAWLISAWAAVACAILSAPILGTPVTTDRDGRFPLNGISERASAILEIDDPRFAHQSLVFAAGEEGRTRPKTMPLLPPQVINVRVIRGDDGKPMAAAWVVVQAGEKSTGARADDQGHARISAWPGQSFTIVAYAKDGEPYIRCETSLDWPSTRSISWTSSISSGRPWKSRANRPRPGQ